MNVDELTLSAGSRSGGTLRLKDGRCILVQSIHHVGEDFLFFVLHGSTHTHVVRHDEIQAWEAETPIGERLTG